MITATCKALAVNVLFCAQSSGNVRMLGFQQGNALEFLKYFGTLSLFHFKAMPWSDNFSSTNQKVGRGVAGDLYFPQTFVVCFEGV